MLSIPRKKTSPNLSFSTSTSETKELQNMLLSLPLLSAHLKGLTYLHIREMLLIKRCNRAIVLQVLNVFSLFNTISQTLQNWGQQSSSQHTIAFVISNVSKVRSTLHKFCGCWEFNLWFAHNVSFSHFQAQSNGNHETLKYLFYDPTKVLSADTWISLRQHCIETRIGAILPMSQTGWIGSWSLSWSEIPSTAIIAPPGCIRQGPTTSQDKAKTPYLPM